MRHPRLMVPVLAGVLGIVAGVVTALVAPADEDRDGGSDPLHLGISLVNLECTGESLLIVARGDSTAPLAAAVANNPGLRLRYLRTADSCDSHFAPPSEGEPDYVVYAGPYDGMPEPCELRMGADHVGDAVTKLTTGAETFVKCACVLPVAGFPDLTPGMEVDPANAIWVRSLQNLLADLDRDRKAEGEPGPYFTLQDVTGIYDAKTQKRIEAYQSESAFSPSEYGSVRYDTWRALTDDTCQLYEF